MLSESEWHARWEAGNALRIQRLKERTRAKKATESKKETSPEQAKPPRKTYVHSEAYLRKKALGEAAYRAEKEGKVCTPKVRPRKEPIPVLPEMGLKAVTIHSLRAHGVEWEAIAEVVGLSMSHTLYLHRKYVAALGVVTEGRRPGVVGKLAYEVKTLNPRATWKDLAVTLGSASGLAAEIGAKRYAETHGLPWPIPGVAAVAEADQKVRAEATAREQARRARAQAKRERDAAARDRAAYDARASGEPWSVVMVALGFKHEPRAIEAARRAAKINGLSWPIRL